MIINNCLNEKGERFQLRVNDDTDQVIDGTHLQCLPGLIDPHVHFRTPGMMHKEDWCTGARAALCGGYTTVFDMPNTLPPTITSEYLHEKKSLINSQLQEVGIPLRYQLFFGADKSHFSELSKVTQEVIGIKVFMGQSTGQLVMDDDESLQKLFEIAADLKLIVAVHAEDEVRIATRKKKFAHESHYAVHSEIRDEEVARIASDKAIELALRFKTRLYLLHVSTFQELELIRAAKKTSTHIYAETTPHHLFLNTHAYEQLAGCAVVNPPLRAESHHAALWEAVMDGTIDTIGSDHAPHLLAEKKQAYGICPSGMPGIETTFPLLYTEGRKQGLTLERILALTCYRPRAIFNLPSHDDFILVDVMHPKTVDEQALQTKCAWSPFKGRVLAGWPIYAMIQQKFYDLAQFKRVIA